MTISLLLLLAIAALAPAALSATGVKSLRTFSRHELEGICRQWKAEDDGCKQFCPHNIPP